MLDRLTDFERALESGDRDLALRTGRSLLTTARRLAPGDPEAFVVAVVLTDQVDDLTDDLPPAERIAPWAELRALARQVGVPVVELGASLKLAMLHLDAGNTEAATEHAKLTLALVPRAEPVEIGGAAIGSPGPDVVGAVVTGVVEDLYYRHENFADARDLAAGLTALDPDSRAGWFFLAHARVRLGDHAEAVPALHRLVELVPDQPGAFITLAGSLYNTGRPAEAVEAASKAIELKPDNLQYRYHRAQLHAATDHPELALADLDTVIARAQGLPRRAPDPDQTQIQYERDMPPEDLHDLARVMRLHVLVDLGRAEAARAEARYIAETGDGPTSAAAHAFLGDLAAEEGDHQAAVSHYSAHLDRMERPQARLALAAAQEELGRVDDAAATLDGLSGQEEGKDPRAAVEALTELLGRHPGHVGVRKALGHALLEAWAPGRAAEVLLDLLEEQPDDWQARAWAGMAMVTHSDAEEDWNASLSDTRILGAVRLLADAVRLAPDEPQPRAQLRWLVERACAIPSLANQLVVAHVLVEDPDGPGRVLPELADVFARWFAASTHEGPAREWAQAVPELLAAREAATRAGLPLLGAMTDIRLADNYLRLYEVQEALDRLAAAEAAMVEVGRLPVMWGPVVEETAAEVEASGRRALLVDWDHLEFSTAVHKSLTDVVAVLRSQALQRIGDVEGALDAVGDLSPDDAEFDELHHRAVLLRDAGRADEALALLPRLAELADPDDGWKLANLEATLHLGREDYPAAAAVIERVLEEVPPDSYEASVFVGNLTTAYVQQSEYAKALDLLDRYPLPAGAQLPLVYGRHLLRAQVLQGSGDNGGALQSYVTALDTAEELRGRLHDEPTRMAWQERQLATYEAAVVTALIAGDPVAALELVERSKARAFVDQLSLGHVEPTEQVERLRANWSRARDRHAALAALARSAHPAEEVDLQQRYRELNAGRNAPLDDLARELDAEQAAVDRLARLLALERVRSRESVAGRTLTGPEIHALLAEDRRCVLAEYFVAADQTLLFVLTPDDPEPQVYGWEIGAEALAEEVAGFFGGAVRTMDVDDFDAFFGALLAPVLDHSEPGDVVLLVPHGPLHYVPLHAPLVERNPVCRAPSASLLRYRRRAATRQWRTALVFGDSRGDLVHSRQEAALVASLFDAEPALGEAASRARLDQAVGGALGPDLVHLACHGRFDDDRAVDSAVLLADGELTVQDLFQLRLSANLVTLSACESGVNATRPGDELIGLTRAVLYAGAPSLVVSLWAVDDLSTALLMGEFYRRVRAGADLADALREAQLALAATTARDVVAHCDRRLAEETDPQAAAALLLDRAGAQTVAGDLAAAGESCRAVLAADVRGEAGARLKARATRTGNLVALKAEVGAEVDYGARPFAHPYHWAAFALVGDWR
ncbi:CHAT domain-containing protein [Saccharothrix variisporea]|uniref:Tetratricopeptide repeat protein n=1 Tax=Saccharothrix variisporea TaxID=543527 RepID=A0A495XTE7_9PSEU|nr:CHAT domain-containing protein [Saccharothrix variisporea]RKT74958.1 tetratricopeptide repeat protein [Saccharothrix variisporea]